MPDEANYLKLENILARGTRDRALPPEWRRQRHVDHLLTAYLGGPPIDRVFVAIQAARSLDRKINIGASVHRRRRARETPSWPQRVRAWGGMAAALALFALLWWWNTSHTTVVIATVERSSPNARLIRGGLELPIRSGMAVHRLDQLQSPSPGLVLAWPDGSKVSLIEPARLRLWQEADAKRIELVTGTIACIVASQPSGQPFQLQTTQGLATVLGTKFMLSAERGRTLLHVSEGRVLLHELFSGSDQQVAAGESAQAIDASFGSTVFDHDFTALVPGESITGTLTRLVNGQDSATVVSSISVSPEKRVPGWTPDYKVGLEGRAISGLFTVPADMEIRFRIHAERAGTISLSMTPTSITFWNEHFYVSDLPVAAGWSTVIVHASDLLPYRNRKEGSTRDLRPSQAIRSLGFWGIQTGPILIDRFTVIAPPGSP